MTATPRDFPRAARAALNDAALQSALARMKAGFPQRGRMAMAALPDADAMRSDARAIRDYALSHLDELLVRFETHVRADGGYVHWARNGEEARDIITRILTERGARTVTKGKTMLGEEIGLNAHLQTHGVTPVETDLGEYIVQLRGERPSHIIAPAFHLRWEDVEDTFRKAHTQFDIDREILARSDLVAEARDVLRTHFLAADAGITGANFLVAETGTAIVVTNEGNGDLTRLLPKTHIVLAGIEKVVDTLADASFLLRLLTRAATGQDISTYVSFMSGPRRKGENDGPQEFHVVLLDNGRASLLGSPAEEVLRCIRCAACANHCPVYGSVGGHAYGAVYSGPIGAALMPGLRGVGEAHHLPEATSCCGRCDAVCPVKIPLTRIMRHWRNVAFAEGAQPFSFRMGLRAWAWLARRPGLYTRVGNLAARLMPMFTAGGRVRWLPMFRGWFKERDLPAPARKSFQAQWRARKSAR
jgi:L-lactate dehydrogenase complex protein LldF